MERRPGRSTARGPRKAPRSSRPGSTGTCGSGRAPSGPTAARLTPFVWRYCLGFRQRHACATWRRTISIPRSTRSGSTRPMTIEARASDRRSREIAPGSHQVTYQFPARGDRAAADTRTGTTAGSGRRHRPASIPTTSSAPRRRPERPDVVGEKGVLTCAGWSGMPRLLPLELHRSVQAAAEDAAARRGTPRGLAAGLQGRHARVQQLRGRRSPDGVHPAQQRRAPDRQDPEVGRGGVKATNVPQADAFIDGTYRKGWELAV